MFGLFDMLKYLTNLNLAEYLKYFPTNTNFAFTHVLNFSYTKYSRLSKNWDRAFFMAFHKQKDKKIRTRIYSNITYLSEENYYIFLLFYKGRS